MFPITQPNIINVAELRAVITEAMAELPSDLERHCSGIQACLTRAAATHDSVRPARRRQGDPAWAQIRFDQGDLLHRFDTRRADQLIREIQHLLSLLQQVGCRAKNRLLPLSAEAEAWLRGLAHRHASFEALSDQAEELLGRAAVADLRADRHKGLRTPRHVSAGGLSAVRCVSVAEIMGLGRMARNCMVTDSDLWKRFANGVADVWSVRRGQTLVAVLEVHRASGAVVAVAGPRNRRIAAADERRAEEPAEIIARLFGIPEYAFDHALRQSMIALRTDAATLAHEIDASPVPFWHLWGWLVAVCISVVLRPLARRRFSTLRPRSGVVGS